MKLLSILLGIVFLTACSPKSIFVLEKQKDVNLEVLRTEPSSLILNISEHPKAFRVTGNQPTIHSLKDAQYSLALKSGFNDSHLGDVRTIWINDYTPSQITIEQLVKNDKRSTHVLHLSRSEIVLEEKMANLGRISTLMRCNFFFDFIESDTKSVSFRVYSEDELNLNQSIDDEISECFRIAINKLMRKGKI
ncbi:MAG: hypothetical protein ACRBF0_04605 [Calditrichia bacterium]